MTSDSVLKRLSNPSCRLGLAGFVLVVITVIAAGLTVLDRREEAIATYQREMNNLGVVLAEQTARSMQAVDLVLEEVRAKALATGATTPEQFRNLAGTEEFHGFLAGRAANLPQASAVGVIDAGGDFVNSSRVWPTPALNLADRDYFTHLRDHADPGAFVSAPARNRVDGAWSFFLTRRISGPRGELLGIVLAVVDIRHFEGFFESIILQPGGAVTVFRRDGTMLARHPHVERMMGEKLAPQAPFYALLAKGGGTGRTPGYIDGNARVVSVHPLRDFPLVATLTVAEDAALADWRRQSLLIAVGALGAVLGFAVLFGALAVQSRKLERHTAALRAASAAAEAANDAKSRFLANVSHELRTPLNAILGFSEMLQLGLVGPLAPRQAEYVGLIRDSGDHLHEVINDILDLAKIDAGKLVLRAEDEIDPNRIVDACLALMQERARLGMVRLSAGCEERLPVILADATRLKQILLNLLSNAIKFTPAGGLVDVAVRRTPQGGVAFAVADTGVGMSASDIDIALECFGQVDAGLARCHEGTGLGLPLARRLAELHSGSLDIVSEKGRGTTVTVTLPPSSVAYEPAATVVASKVLAGVA